MEGSAANIAKLAQKINAIANNLGKVTEDGTNTHSRYKFISHQQLSALLRPLLQKHNVAILPSVIAEREEHFESNGKRTIRTLVEMLFRVVDCDTGHTEEFRFSGADQDMGGKSLAQAITETQKRFEMKLFHVSSKDEVDPDEKTTEIPETTQRVVTAAKKTFGADAKVSHRELEPKVIFQKAMQRAGHDLHRLNDECKAKWEKGIGELSVSEMRAIAETKGVKVEL